MYKKKYPNRDTSHSISICCGTSSSAAGFDPSPSISSVVIPEASTVLETHSLSGSSFKSSRKRPANTPPKKATGSYRVKQKCSEQIRQYTTRILTQTYIDQAQVHSERSKPGNIFRSPLPLAVLLSRCAILFSPSRRSLAMISTPQPPPETNGAQPRSSEWTEVRRVAYHAIDYHLHIANHIQAPVGRS
ncbi:hypothetical protein L484_006208 [Morus notabilis]|uniref:Uncharacterized protein n=1 Tax=Morus notabilis TaxID=981085 RepID=W9QL54_9ROSA|nr:hypothetical protein L484_006208 [Morus notabilis]